MTIKMKPQAVGYIRTAYDDGGDARVLSQIAMIENFCLHEGLELVTTYRDMGVSGLTPFAQRPGAARLLTNLEPAPTQYVVVADITRLGRSLDTIDDARRAIGVVDVIIAGRGLII